MCACLARMPYGIAIVFVDLRSNARAVFSVHSRTRTTERTHASVPQIFACVYCVIRNYI